jgi:hypothetical protein
MSTKCKNLSSTEGTLLIIALEIWERFFLCWAAQAHSSNAHQLSGLEDL